MLLCAAGTFARAAEKLLPSDWNPKAAGDAVLRGLTKISPPQVKGAHDSDFVYLRDRVYVVYIANDVQPGENPEWSFCYAAMSVVDPQTRRLEKFIPFARSGQAYDHATLPPGACFVPRLLVMDERTLRAYFASEEPGKRQSQIWFIDFDTERMSFRPHIDRARLKTSQGTFDMQPQSYYADAVAHGFRREPRQHGLYLIDGFKIFDGRTYAVVNNFAIGQNGWALVNDTHDTFEILGQFNPPAETKLTEASVNRLPDGTWLAISRQETGTKNYMFATSADGRQWSANAYRDFIPDGTNSKPTFDKFDGVYYLGWQEAAKIDGVGRSVFNIDVSRDGREWERKYRFETAESFQYPTFRQHAGAIYLTVTQGRKERIMFGELESPK